MKPDRFLCGWRVRSDLDLPDLPEFAGDDRPVDVEIILGQPPGELADPVRKTPFMQVGRDGTVLVTVPGIVRFHIQDAGRVVFNLAKNADSATVRVFLFGSVLGILCHLRGMLPLHAAVIDIGGRAVGLAGLSGAGKSTLAAGLLQRGHRLLSEDLCIVDRPGGDGPGARLWPHATVLKLKRDALTGLGISPEGLAVNRNGKGKYLLPVPPAPGQAQTPPRLHAVLMLSQGAPGESDRIDWLGGFDRFSHVMDQVYRVRAIAALGRKAELFRDVTRIVGEGGVEIGLFRRAKRYERMADQVRLIEDAAARP